MQRGACWGWGARSTTWRRSCKRLWRRSGWKRRAGRGAWSKPSSAKSSSFLSSRSGSWWASANGRESTSSPPTLSLYLRCKLQSSQQTAPVKRQIFQFTILLIVFQQEAGSSLDPSLAPIMVSAIQLVLSILSSFVLRFISISVLIFSTKVLPSETTFPCLCFSNLPRGSNPGHPPSSDQVHLW